MNTKISTKIAALGMALMMSGIVWGGIGYLFDAQLLQHARVVTLAVV
jgi:hypothetical protein